MKRITSLIIAAAIILSLTGCGDARKTDSGANSQSEPMSGDLIQGDSSSEESAPNVSEGDSSTADNDSSDTSTDGDIHKSPLGELNGEMSGSVFVLNNGRAISLYGGGFQRGKNYAKSLSEVKKRVGDRVNVFSLVAPTSGSFYLPEKYKDNMASEQDNIDNINENLSGVIPVDAFSALSKHVDEDIFLRTDHHWSQLGAFYAAEEFARTALTSFAPLSEYETQSREGYVGTMYGFSGEDARIKNNPETFTIYIPKNDFKTTHIDPDLTNEQDSYLFDNLQAVDLSQCYLVFHVDDGGVTRVITDVKNKRKLLVVKDSYANALVPCLTNSFEEIWAVDMRTFKKSISETVKEKGITDVLFCMNTFSATGDNQYDLEDIL